jgi:hypothetical protein
VIGAYDFVAERYVGARPEEKRAEVGQVLEEVIGIARQHLHMLGGDAICLLY